ncbi:VOC family protein [Cohnella endophytica]|uniref:VOC family protein n=1 Tax=Cohnella endophytica TaxID=2419778 RepID=A0A494Y7B0_9BACL|nr:VOC family protein [Cohnella endophytica]RKP57963.1 VOC family protein [Cohnella endophytica]
MRPIVSSKLLGVMLYAKDLKRASNWYSDKLGFQITDYNFDDFVELAIEGTYVMHLFRDLDLVPITRAVFSFNTYNIEHAYIALKNNGVEVDSLETYGDHKSFSFKDCEGNQLMISQYD